MNILSHEVLANSLAGIFCGLMMFGTLWGLRISEQYANGWKSFVALLACQVTLLIASSALAFVFMSSLILALNGSGFVCIIGPIFCLLFFFAPLILYSHYERNRNYSPKKSRRLWCGDRG